MRSLLVLPLLLVGCSETGLTHAPPIETTDAEAPALDPSGDDPGGGLPGGGDGGPWGDLDSGNLPDEYFVVAWRPEPCEDCFDEFSGVETGHRVDVVDLEGRVVVELERPFDDAGVLFHHAQPAGDGTFLVVESIRQDTYYYQPSLYQQRVWRADALSGETVEVARMTWETLELPLSGRSIPVPRLWQARFAADPDDPNILWVATSGDQSAELSILRVDIADPDAEPRIWGLPDPSVLFAVEDQQYWASVPARLAVQRVDGDVQVEVTLEGGSVYADPMELPRGLLVFRPGDGSVTGVANLRRRMYLADARWSGSLDDSPLLMQAGVPQGYCSEPAFAVVPPGAFADAGEYGRWDPDPRLRDDVASIDGDASLTCARLGPLLDMAGPTFVYWGDRETTDTTYRMPPSRIALSHRGQDVWTWETLRVGLRETEFRLMGIERIAVP